MKDYTSPTTTLDLTAAAKAHPTLRRYHIGTFPLDALASLTVGGRPRHLIYNESPSTRPPGSHWVSVWLTKDFKAEIVNSLGRQPLAPEVLSFVRRHSASAKYSDRQIQSWTSNVCGLYCLSHGLARARGQSLDSWMKQFTERLADNDDLVQCEFMRELAIPSMFSPSLRNWRKQVERACRNVSLRRAPYPTGWHQPRTPPLAAAAAAPPQPPPPPRVKKRTRTQCVSSQRTPLTPTPTPSSKPTLPTYPIGKFRSNSSSSSSRKAAAAAVT